MIAKLPQPQPGIAFRERFCCTPAKIGKVHTNEKDRHPHSEAANPTMTKGAIIIGLGNYASLALFAADSLRQVGWRYDILIVTSESGLKKQVQAIGSNVDIHVVQHPGNGSWDNRNIKTAIIDLSPWDETLYLDADTVAVSNINNIFQYIEDTPIALAVDRLSPTIGKTYYSCDVDKTRTISVLGIESKAYNSGVIVFRRNDIIERLSALWKTEWKTTLTRDQNALCRALHLTHTPVADLPVEYNYLLDESDGLEEIGKRIADCRILHYWNRKNEASRIVEIVRQNNATRFGAFAAMPAADVRAISVSHPHSNSTLVDRLITTRWQYELHGRERRPMQFHPDGRIGEGAEQVETYWKIEGENPIVLDSSYKETIRLNPIHGGAWAGQWLMHERTAVRLTPDSLVERSSQNPTIWFCTTCMGRLSNLRVTLTYNLRAMEPFMQYVRLVLLDYNCPDGTSAWIRRHHADALASGQLVLLRSTTPAHFHMSHAKNVAHRCAGDGVLCNLDSDNFLDGDYIRYLREFFRRDNGRAILRCTGNGRGGRVAMRRALFEELGGYDESMTGWGYEDVDIVERARLAGCFITAYCGRAPFLDNTKEERSSHYAENDRADWITNNRNETISRENIRLRRINPNQLRGITWGQVLLERM